MGDFQEPADELASRTATHEAGHCIIAELCGLRVMRAELMHPQVGITHLPIDPDEQASNDLHRAHVDTALGGYPAVGEVWGTETEQANRIEDIHDWESDLGRALRRADHLDPHPADLCAFVLEREATVREQLSDHTVRSALEHVAEVLFESWVRTQTLGVGAPAIEGNHVRDIMADYGIAARAEPGQLV